MELHLLVAVCLEASHRVVRIVRGGGRHREAWSGLWLRLDVRLERR